MNETIVRIRDNGTIVVEEENNGIKSFKQIAPDTLISCINQSIVRGVVSSGLLPANCLSFSQYDNGNRGVVLIHHADRANISFFGTEYPDFPIPRIVFGYCISAEGRISECRLGVIDNVQMLKPDTPMFHYPLSNVSGFHLCTGNNTLPQCKSLHTLTSLGYHIMSMPNNLDYYSSGNNRLKLEMRDLLELLKDKEQGFYYSDVLVSNGKTLRDFIK